MSATPPSFSPENLSAHAEWLRHLARSLERDEHAAEDAVQETYAAALAARPDAGAALRPWLASVLRRLLARDHRRRRRAGSRERANAREERLPSTAEALVEFELHERLLRAVRELEEPHRTVIVMRFFEGLPPREIARRSGIAAGAARTRLSRALNQLRERLGVAPRRSPFERWMLLPGGIWMSAKSTGAVAATLVILSGVAWWVLREVESAEPEHASIASAERAASGEREETEESANALSAHVARAADSVTPTADPLSFAGAAIAPRDLVVRVVDAAGRELPEFPLELQYFYPERDIFRGATVEKVFTDGAGHYVFANAAERCAAIWEQHARRARTGPRRVGDVEAVPTFAATMWAICPMGIELREPSVSFDPSALPAEARVLVIPGSGSLRVRFTGSFPTAGLALDVQALPETTPEASRRWNAPATLRFTTREREMHWPYVALGQLVRITATPEDGSAPPASAVVLGPRIPGDAAVALLPLEEPYPTIIGRVLRGDGSALASAALGARVRKQREGQLHRVGGIAVMQPPGETRSIATDANGAFRLPISDAEPIEGASWLHLEVLPKPGSSAAAIGSIAEWQIPLPLTPGIHDAGALFLREKPLLASGIALGPAGAPLAGVRIVPSLQCTDALRTTSTWSPLEALATTSDESGRFALRGVLESELIRLSPSRAGFAASEEPEVAHGATDVRIQLVAGAHVVGRVLLPPGLTGPELRVRLHRGERTLAMAEVARDGSFRFEDVSTALCDVRVWTEQGNRLLCTVADVEPWRTGEGDPRLAGIDLTREWRIVPVRVLDAERQPFYEQFLQVAPLGVADPDGFYAQTSHEGRVALVLPAAASRFYISEARHAGLILECRDTEQEVQLGRAIQLSIELEKDGFEAVRSERMALLLDLDPAGASELAGAHISPFVHVAEDGRARVELPLAGRYRVRWMRRTTSGPVHAYQTADDIEAVFVEVVDRRSEQRVKIATPEALK